jgi:hypothetical protein
LSDANCHQAAKADSELATLIAGWTKMPDSIRAEIVAMVRAVDRADLRDGLMHDMLHRSGGFFMP